MKSPPTLILASTSVYRRELLSRLKIPFECRSPGIDETPHRDEPALELVTRLAREKAAAVAAVFPDAWVIGSDQVAVLRDDAEREVILGKPGNAAACVAQLMQCSGRSLSFVTAVAVRRHCDASISEFLDTTRVIYRDLDRASIERYVTREMPIDCAGGFKSEALGVTLCSAIETQDPSGLVGLPLIKLCAVLRQAGFDLP